MRENREISDSSMTLSVTSDCCNIFERKAAAIRIDIDIRLLEDPDIASCA